ncbi:MULTISPECIES: O-methyltransferase [Clostridium]|uniref:tRNA 5-hydroxyuridine methyltransferase n=1 Tax=Clostridium senegalense TaxID=1465809 RepID=A0A6M0H0U5_9CLOT|nr:MULTISPECIES: O-methyltransferase [Clostridium]NEU03838.1 O-methyltransferase [Clostridium senegalense]
MSGVTYEYMENYLRSLIPDDIGILKEMHDFAMENKVPIIQKEGAKFLQFMVNFKKPKRILELGTAIGYSSILMNLASGGSCEITTIERDENMLKIASENIEKYGLKDKITVLPGDCLEVLEKLNDKYDMIFMDAGKGHYNHFLPHCLRLLEKDGIIVADNVLFRGMVACNDLVKRRKITIVKRMRSYLDMVSSDENLVTTVIPMGDGIALTVRRNENDKTRDISSSR